MACLFLVLSKFSLILHSHVNTSLTPFLSLMPQAHIYTYKYMSIGLNRRPSDLFFFTLSPTDQDLKPVCISISSSSSSFKYWNHVIEIAKVIQCCIKFVLPFCAHGFFHSWIKRSHKESARFVLCFGSSLPFSVVDLCGKLEIMVFWSQISRRSDRRFSDGPRFLGLFDKVQLHFLRSVFELWIWWYWNKKLLLCILCFLFDLICIRISDLITSLETHFSGIWFEDLCLELNPNSIWTRLDALN